MEVYQQSPVPQNFAPILIPDDVAVYRIGRGKFYIDDELHEAGSIIRLDGEPNLEMEPLNKMAKECMLKYLKKLDACGKAVAEKNGVLYTGLAAAFQNATDFMKNEGRRLNGNREAPIFGKTKKNKKASRIDISEVSFDPLELPSVVNETSIGKKDAKMDS